MWRFLQSNEGDNSKWAYDIVIIEPRASVFFMRLEDNWIQAPQDIEVWIGKQKIVRVHYMGPRQRSIVDYDALAERWRQQFGRRSSMLRAKRIEYKKDRERLERRFGQRRGR
jgi:hypothetical protein